ncbi:MAG: hypothetical protein IH975_07805, partial [Nitrospinae bacterium]|nr:hypothetical protein [Nitrospinota bacterium]
GARGKTPVVGLAQRAGPLVALTLPDVSRKSLHASIRSHVRPGGRKRAGQSRRVGLVILRILWLVGI